MTASLKILVVEDDLDGGAEIAQFLRAEGHEVVVAGDGESALASARGAKIDAVLLDLHLPDMLGYEVAHALRAGVLSEIATIVMITGDATAELDRANATGIDIVLHKPIEPVAIGRLLEFVRTQRRRRFSLSPLRVPSRL